MTHDVRGTVWLKVHFKIYIMAFLTLPAFEHNSIWGFTYLYLSHKKKLCCFLHISLVIFLAIIFLLHYRDDSGREKLNVKSQGLDTAKLFYIGFCIIPGCLVIDGTGRRIGLHMLIAIQWLSKRVCSVTNKIPSENSNGKLVSWHQLCTLQCWRWKWYVNFTDQNILQQQAERRKFHFLQQ